MESKNNTRQIRIHVNAVLLAQSRSFLEKVLRRIATGDEHFGVCQINFAMLDSFRRRRLVPAPPHIRRTHALVLGNCTLHINAPTINVVPPPPISLVKNAQHSWRSEKQNRHETGG